MKKIVFVIVSMLFLSACATHYASDGEQRYTTNKNGATVVVPPPLTDSNMSHFYDLPDQNQDPQVSIVPPV